MEGDPDPRRERSRHAIVQTARGILFEDGLGAVTHLAIARRSGVGRKTVYRHFPSRTDLLHATLSTAEFPRGMWTGDLRGDVLSYLLVLADALTRGPLAFFVASLVESATVEPQLAPLRRRLAKEGCQPLRSLLDEAATNGILPASVDLDEVQDALEGPLFYRAMVRDLPIDEAYVRRLVCRVLP